MRAQARGLDSAVFFGILHGILLGAEKIKFEDWPAVLELFEAIWKTPLPLYHILSSDYYYKYFFNFGVAHDKLGRPEQAAHFNLGNVLYKEGEIPAALASWSKVVELNGQHAGAW